MANFIFNKLYGLGITTNPNVGFCCAIFFYFVLLFCIAGYISTYGMRGVIRTIETAILLSCRLVLEVLIFTYILVSYKKKHFFVKYKKRRAKVLKRIARR